MNAFLARFAEKHGKLGLSHTYALPEITETGKAPIAAYFTLTTSNVTREQIPTKQSLPHYPVPLILMARLDVAIRHKGTGLDAKTKAHTFFSRIVLARTKDSDFQTLVPGAHRYFCQPLAKSTRTKWLLSGLKQ
ncbi:hypothetical protein WKI13_06200 [Teredinibacter turnerae]|uniref:hypothetical protein n=1 Tax=Teredinibacter turnerae TaxID=2426 RepID=UPI00037308A8|nr:hypothetical protein [Teredinibacter turnerae]